MSDAHFTTDTMTDINSFGTDLDADNLASPNEDKYLYSPEAVPHDRLPHSMMLHQQSAPAGLGEQHSTEGTNGLNFLSSYFHSTKVALHVLWCVCNCCILILFMFYLFCQHCHHLIKG